MRDYVTVFDVRTPPPFYAMLPSMQNLVITKIGFAAATILCWGNIAPFEDGPTTLFLFGSAATACCMIAKRLTRPKMLRSTKVPTPR